VSHVALALALGLAGGVLAGLFGVGGGIIFVPALTLGLGLSQLTAEATSLAAIVPVVAVGSFRQHRAGLVEWRSAAVIGICSLAGVLIGAEIALRLPETTLRRAFAAFLVLAAAQMALRASRQLRPAEASYESRAQVDGASDAGNDSSEASSTGSGSGG
jgi:uncharacterized membrane protein YfcA